MKPRRTWHRPESSGLAASVSAQGASQSVPSARAQYARRRANRIQRNVRPHDQGRESMNASLRTFVSISERASRRAAFGRPWIALAIVGATLFASTLANASTLYPACVTPENPGCGMTGWERYDGVNVMH